MIKIPEKISVPLVSAFVLMVLILQSFSGFVDTGRWGWPFVAYPMYKLAHQDGERILHDFTLYAKLPDGKLVEVTRDELGMGFWHFEKHVANPMLENHQEKMLSLADEYCKKSSHRIIGFILKDKGFSLSRFGVVDGLEPTVLASMDLECEQ